MSLSSPEPNIGYSELERIIREQQKQIDELRNTLRINSKLVLGSAATTNGWSGSIFWVKSFGVVTVYLQTAKTSWAVNDTIYLYLPVGYRPYTYAIMYGMNGNVNNDHRNAWINNDGSVQTGKADTDSIYAITSYVASF